MSYRNKNTARREDLHYCRARESTIKAHTTIKYHGPPVKSCNNKSYGKSTTTNPFNRTGKPHSHEKTSEIEGKDFGKMVQIWEKLAICESKLELMGKMNRMGVGFNEVEEFANKIEKKKTEKESNRGVESKSRKLVTMTMSMKVMDERRKHSKLLKEKTEAKRKIFETHRESRDTARKILRKLRKVAKSIKKENKVKNDRKVKHLVEKQRVREKKMNLVRRKRGTSRQKAS